MWIGQMIHMKCQSWLSLKKQQQKMSAAVVISNLKGYYGPKLNLRLSENDILTLSMVGKNFSR